MPEEGKHMKANDIIKEILREQDLTAAWLSRRVGISKQSMSERLTAADPRVSSVVEELDALGYKLVVVKKWSDVGGREVECPEP